MKNKKDVFKYFYTIISRDVRLYNEYEKQYRVIMKSAGCGVNCLDSNPTSFA